MPTTRRSTGGARARPGPAKGQSTISFSNKVTKNIPRDAKQAVVSPPVAKVESVDTVKPDEEDPVDQIEVPDAEADPQVDVEPETQVPEKPSAELKAEKITDAQVSKYWKAIEKERKAPRVHQEDLTLSEKILRYFDVSSQYGPCIGMTRMKRWHRAERLGLQPPVEVLAVLLKEEHKGNAGIETAQMDQIMNSTAIGA